MAFVLDIRVNEERKDAGFKVYDAKNKPFMFVAHAAIHRSFSEINA